MQFFYTVTQLREVALPNRFEVSEPNFQFIIFFSKVIGCSGRQVLKNCYIAFKSSWEE